MATTAAGGTRTAAAAAAAAAAATTTAATTAATIKKWPNHQQQRPELRTARVATPSWAPCVVAAKPRRSRQEEKGSLSQMREGTTAERRRTAGGL